MSRITIDNYEAYLLDFSEGKLSGEDLRELEVFFELHPELDIRSELGDLPGLTGMNEGFEEKTDLLKSTVYLEDEDLISYLEGILSAEQTLRVEAELSSDPSLREKLSLYKATRLPKETAIIDKTVLYKNEDDLLLANLPLNYVEGCLPEAEKLDFESKMAGDISLNNEVVLLNKTKLAADNEVVFENKQSLKKEARVIVLFSRVAMARVAAVLLIVFALLLPFYLRHNDVVDQDVKALNVAPAETEAPVNAGTPQVNPQGTEVVKTAETSTPGSTENKRAASEKTMQAQPLANPVAINQQTTETQAEPVNLPENNKAEEKTDQLAALSNEQPKEQRTIKDSLSAFESFANISELEFTEEKDDMESSRPEGGFWKRAVNFAKTANKFGVKSIEGEENTSVKYRLSFKSFSVEKR